MGVVTVDLGGSEWHEFVANRDDSTFFHTSAWAEVIAETYGFPVFGVVDTLAQGARAGVPVADVSRLGRRRWVSFPFSDRCPLLGAEDDRLELTRELGVAKTSLRLRQIELRDATPGCSSARRPSGVLHLLALAAGEDEMMRRLRRTQVARNITRSERERVQVTVDHSAESVETFYALHLLTRRRLGVPIQPRRFFHALHRHVIGPGLGFVLVARVGRRPVAAAITLDHKDTLTYKFGASDPDARSARPNHAVFWAMIRWGIAHGRRILDMGRSDLENTGLREFKSSWGATESPLTYTFLGNTPHERGGGPQRLLRPIIRKSPPMICRLIGETVYRYSA